MRRCAPVKRKRPDQLGKLLLCKSVIAPLEHHLRTTGREYREEAALITGYVTADGVGLGTTVLLPHTENRFAKNRFAACALPLDVTLGCVDLMTSADQILLAQVHTHPGRVCSHSHTDDHGAFSDCAGLFSIVVPLYARYGVGDLHSRGIAIHERMPTGGWRRLAVAEARTRVAIVEADRAVL